MRHWELAVSLDPHSGQPLFLQLADAIAEDIRRGRLRADDALPGTRGLAAQLGLNRNTVVAAYEELAAQGSVRTRVGGGTFVTAATPLARVRPFAQPPPAAPTFALAPAAPDRLVAPATPAPGTLLLAGGAPDPRLFPARALARAFRRAIEARGRAAPGAGGPCGHARLRDALADMLARARTARDGGEHDGHAQHRTGHRPRRARARIARRRRRGRGTRLSAGMERIAPRRGRARAAAAR